MSERQSQLVCGLNRVGLALSTSAQLETAPSLFAENIPPRLVVAAVKDVLRNELATSRVVATAQVHPNEFRKIVLAVGANASKLVLHRWNGAAAEFSDIHNHRWNFCSQVISGAITSEIFSVRPSYLGDYIEYSYSSPGVGDSYGLVKVACAEVNLNRSVTHQSADCYVQNAKEVHRARDLCGSSLTLVAQGRPLESKGRVFAPTSSKISGCTKVVRPARRQVIADLTELLDALVPYA